MARADRSAGKDVSKVQTRPSFFNSARKGRGEVDVVMTVDGKAANPVRVSIK